MRHLSLGKLGLAVGALCLASACGTMPNAPTPQAQSPTIGSGDQVSSFTTERWRGGGHHGSWGHGGGYYGGYGRYGGFYGGLGYGGLGVYSPFLYSSYLYPSTFAYSYTYPYVYW